MKSFFAIFITVLFFLRIADTLYAQDGKVVLKVIHSSSIEDNFLGDIPDKHVAIYLPPNYDKNLQLSYPVIYLLHGFTLNYNTWLKGGSLNMNIESIMNRLIKEEKIQPMIIVMPSGYNKYHGCWYVNSSVTGNWEDYIVDDLIDYIDSRYRTLARRESRGIAGHSMGGTGSLKLVMKHPDLYSLVYSLSAGMISMKHTLTMPENLPYLIEATKVTDPEIFSTLFWKTRVHIAAAAAFAPNKTHLPFYGDFPVDTGGVAIDSNWVKWLENDAYTMINSYKDSLLKLDGIWIECGTQDDLHNANFKFHQELESAVITHTWQDYTGGHMDQIAERIEKKMLPFFSNRLACGYLKVPNDFETIQDAINAAIDGNIIIVDEGNYNENINFKGKSITLASRFYLDGDTSHISNTIINGSMPTHPDSGSVVYFISGEDTTSILCGFTITGGTGTITDLGFPGKGGGGIYLVNASAKISNNIIINNSVTNDNGTMGGGLLSGPPEYHGFIVIENNLFESNSCYGNQILAAGGGMLLAGSARVSNNTFKNNLISSTNGEAFGAGLSCAQNMDSVIINQNIVINNKAETFFGKDDIDAALGGGIMLFYDHTASIRIMDNIIAGNEVSGDNWTAAAGIGIEDVMGEILFANNLVYGNFYSGSVDCHGTGICIFDNTEVKIINNTIFGNEASPYAGGLATWKTISTVAINNIFWGNSLGVGMKEVGIWDGKAPDILYSNVQGGWDDHDLENHNWKLEPLFVDAENGNFNLMEESPGIGWGLDSTIVPKTDFFGTIRPHTIDPYVDIGAIESPYVQTPATALENDKKSLPLKFALQQNYPNPFNPTTNIEYSVRAQHDVPQLVNISIYNILGQKVATLINTKQPAGSYQVQWDASGFGSGVYLYTLETANGYKQTKKLVLLK